MGKKIMASEIFVRKFQNSLIPADGISTEAMESLKPGVVYSVIVKSSRKYKFLQKSMVLVSYAFDIWEPGHAGLSHKGVPIQKNIDKFRDDLTIKAGYYDAVYGIGGVRLYAKSWSFKAMPDDKEFEKLYQSLINVIIEHVLVGYSGADLDRIVNNIVMGFA